MRYLAIAIGGCMGACARYGVYVALGNLMFPWSTFLINLGGSVFLTWFYTMTQERWPIHPHVRLGIGTGFVGAFTTFSTFTADGWTLVGEGRRIEALVYVTVSILCGLLGAWLGYLIAARQSALRYSGDMHEEA